MKAIDCEADLMPNGHLILPKDIVKKIMKNATNFKSIKKRVIILNNSINHNKLDEFCGKWMNDDADEIVNDIRLNREQNNRSESIIL